MRRFMDFTHIFLLTIYGLVRPSKRQWVMRKSKEIASKYD